MFGATYEVTDAAPTRPYDYSLVPREFTDEPPEDQLFRAWDIEDREFAVAVEDAAPAAAFDAVADEGLDPVWASEAEKVPIKKVDIEIVERPAYYLDEAPEHRFVSVGRNRTLELLDERGIEGTYEDAWYHPERDELVAIINYADDRGNARRMTWRASSLTTAERNLILEGEPLDSDAEIRSPAELGDLIYERSPVGQREGLILAHYITGTTSHAEMAAEMGDVSRGSVSSSAYALEDKLDEWAWLVSNVLTHVPEQQLSGDLARLTSNVEEGVPAGYDEREIDGETRLR